MKRKRRTDGWTVLAKRKEVPIQIEPSMMVEHDHEEQAGNAAMKEHQWKVCAAAGVIGISNHCFEAERHTE